MERQGSQDDKLSQDTKSEQGNISETVPKKQLHLKKSHIALIVSILLIVAISIGLYFNRDKFKNKASEVSKTEYGYGYGGDGGGGGSGGGGDGDLPPGASCKLKDEYGVPLCPISPYHVPDPNNYIKNYIANMPASMKVDLKLEGIKPGDRIYLDSACASSILSPADRDRCQQAAQSAAIAAFKDLAEPYKVALAKKVQDVLGEKFRRFFKCNTNDTSSTSAGTTPSHASFSGTLLSTDPKVTYSYHFDTSASQRAITVSAHLKSCFLGMKDEERAGKYMSVTTGGAWSATGWIKAGNNTFSVSTSEDFPVAASLSSAF